MMNETKQPLISLVDDASCCREALVSLLRSAGFQVEDFASAEDFLNSGRLRETACLILDVRMPGMGGLELQRRLAQTGYRIPIVFMSARATDGEQRVAVERGAVDFLRKPFDDEVMLRAVLTAVADHRKEEQP